MPLHWPNGLIFIALVLLYQAVKFGVQSLALLHYMWSRSTGTRRARRAALPIFLFHFLVALSFAIFTHYAWKFSWPNP